MINYANVLLANTAVSFCQYHAESCDKPVWIAPELLKKVISYCSDKNISINFVYPPESVPKELEEIISKTVGTSIRPFSNAKADMIVLKSDDFPECLNADFSDNIVLLSINKHELSDLPKFIAGIFGKSLKLSIVLNDVETYSEADISMYKSVLEKMEDVLFNLYKNTTEKLYEINFITDLWFLKEICGCNAGVSHYTFAPDGKWYVCPAFYHNRKSSIGNFDETVPVEYENLFQLNFAPACKICNAFHCVRCIYLNKSLTEEYNVPSWQQCKIIHAERELSRKLLTRLQQVNRLFLQIPDIKPVKYDDPLENLIYKRK